MLNGIRVTKWHHACLLVDDGRTRILVDPGQLGPRPPLEGVDAVLVTHLHFDHLDPGVVAEAAERGTPVWAPADTLDALGGGHGLHEAVAGAAFTIGTLRVEVSGNRHAEMHPQEAGPENRAYLIAGSVFVTGDEHAIPPGPFRAMFTPINGPWLRASDLIRYVRALRPERVVGIHDGLLNADGLGVARRIVRSLEDEGARHAELLEDGGSITLG